MNKIIEYLKNLFIKTPVNNNQFPLSSDIILNEPDNRDIPYTTVVGLTPQVFPAKAEVSNFRIERLLQGNLGTCVAHTFEFIKRMFDNIIHSRRFLYDVTRNELGITEFNGQGIPQREAAKVACVVGMMKDGGIDDNTLTHKQYTSLVITQDMKVGANKYKFGGFSFPIIDVNPFKQAVVNGHAIAVTLAIDWTQLGTDGIVHPVKNHLDGYHETALGAYDDLTGLFECANWWGFTIFVKYSELTQVVKDALIPIDISNDLLQRAKSTPYVFTADLVIGSSSSAIGQLQSRLQAYGVYTGKIDKSYGSLTLQAVKDYQRIKGIQQDGKVGPATRKCLNDDMGNIITNQKKSKIDLWMEIATKIEGADPANHNPINLKNVGQKEAIGTSRLGMCIFPTDTIGYKMGRDLFVRACSGGSSNYNPNETLYEFYTGVQLPNRFNKKIEGFAPAYDKNQPNLYAEEVAKYMNVDPTIQIKNLL